MDIRSEEVTTSRTAATSVAQPAAVVRVILMGELRQLAGKREWDVELAQGSTVQDLLEKLSALCGQAFTRFALTRERTPHPHVAIFLNGQDIRELRGIQTVLSGGQVELLMLPINEGGA